jgi:Tfp pilus assembly PilM family ATPase
MGLLSLGKVKSAAIQTLSGTMPIAIDFGVGSLKLLQLQAGEPPQLIAAASVDTPDALIGDAAKRFAFQFQALPRALKAANFKGKRAVCSIPAGQTFIKHMQFPRADGVSLPELVSQSVPALLNCSPDALILRHFPVDGAIPPATPANGTSGAKQEVICMAAAREFVSRLMAAVRDAKLECVGIHPECVATIKAFEHINRRASDAQVATLYLDLAAGTTKLWIAHGNTLVFAKTLQIGGGDLDLTVARSLDLDIGTARARRLAASALIAPAVRPTYLAARPEPSTDAMNTPASPMLDMNPQAIEVTGNPSTTATETERRIGKTAPGLTPQVADQAMADLSPPDFDLTEPLESMTDEIAMCLRYYEALFPGKRIDRVIFFGGESRHRGLCQHIAKKIRLPGHVADPLARMSRTGQESVIGVDFTTPQPGWTIAFGLSLCPTDF